VLVLVGLRVIDASTEVAGPYATKLLADAGADVVKVESPDGDPLRRWTAAGLDLPDGQDSALFRFLNTSKRSVVGTVSPFGSSGPWVDRPATEFTLQAACGSTGSRGRKDRPPLAVGGRFGEFQAGVNAAVAAVA